MCVTKINGIYLNQSPLVPFKETVHGFTARLGGVSRGAYESLSMSPRRGDDPSCVRENERLLTAALGLDLGKLTSTFQEHTATVRIVREDDVGRGVSKPWNCGVDGIVTQLRGVPLLCYSADCVPILFYTNDIGAIAAVHAGWRGSAAKIVMETTRILKSLGARAENIYAAIGPCIGKCCYEVSEDVACRFNEGTYLKKPNGKYMLDLARENLLQLVQSGVPAENVSLSGICTACRNDLFFSHRAQGGKSGTLGGIICMR